MPEITRFFGIIIRMYFDDHQPPHFHAIYGRQEIQVGINPIIILQGKLPRRAESMIIEWAALHQQALMENWERLQGNQPANRIPPLE
jgi:hypothetical protein